MKLKVTRAITSHGRYYAAGSIAEMDPAAAGSFVRLYGWIPVEDGPDLSALRKTELQDLAADAGLDTGGTKAELIDRLKG